MKQAIQWAKALSTIVGAILAAATLMGMLNEALLQHLDATFLTKQEFQAGSAQIEQKVDAILRRLDQIEHRRK